MTTDVPARHTDNTRLEAFSDAIFGFAATLLVVSLDVPSTYDALVRSLYGFISFALSFGMLVGIWTMHRAFFRQYPFGDSRTVLLNTLLLFVVLFYVYPLKFLTRLLAVMFLRGLYHGEAVTMEMSQLPGMFTIYGAGWAAVFGCLALMYWHASRESERRGLDDEHGAMARDRFGAFLVMASMGIVSCALAIGNVGVRYGMPGWVYAVIGPALSLYWNRRRRRQSRLAVGAQ